MVVNVVCVCVCVCACVCVCVCRVCVCVCVCVCACACVCVRACTTHLITEVDQTVSSRLQKDSASERNTMEPVKQVCCKTHSNSAMTEDTKAQL